MLSFLSRTFSATHSPMAKLLFLKSPLKYFIFISSRGRSCLGWKQLKEKKLKNAKTRCSHMSQSRESLGMWKVCFIAAFLCIYCAPAWGARPVWWPQGLKPAARQCHPYLLRGIPQGSRDGARIVSLGPQSPHSIKWLDPGDILQQSSNCTLNFDGH